MTARYEEVASADGTWTATVTLPHTDLEYVKSTLFILAHSHPVSAVALTNNDEPSDVLDQLHLYRDPSINHGTPSIVDCDRLAAELTGLTNWPTVRGAPMRAPAELAIVLGLREGYDPAGPHHTPGDIGVRLLKATAWRPCWLLSARHIDDEIRWYDEQAMLLYARTELLPAIVAAAADLGQRRFVVTDYIAGRTYALRREDA